MKTIIRPVLSKRFFKLKGHDLRGEGDGDGDGGEAAKGRDKATVHYSIVSQKLTLTALNKKTRAYSMCALEIEIAIENEIEIEIEIEIVIEIVIETEIEIVIGIEIEIEIEIDI